MTATDLLGFNKADENEIRRNRHEPGPAKDVFGLNKATDEELHHSDANHDE